MGTRLNREWVAFFSQTGQEIADLAEILGRWPDRIITNERPEGSRVIDSRIPKELLYYTENKPTSEEYKALLTRYVDPIITLHGWLRIVPPEICESYEIYNGHPGLITEFPELKGKDPQIRAIEGGYTHAGCVLHKVTPGVDEGRVVGSGKFILDRELEIDHLFLIFRSTSLILWKNFFKADDIEEISISWGE